MPLQEHMQLISVDDHVIERGGVWEDRLPAAYREAGPRMVTIEADTVMEHAGGGGVGVGALHLRAGDQIWVMEGRPYPQVALNAVAGMDRKDWGMEPSRMEQIRPGCYSAPDRVQDMDLDGIQAMCMFPSFPRFSGTRFLETRDQKLALLCVRAWNDFIIEEWVTPYPDRFIPMMILPLWDAGECVREIERMVPRGMTCISFPENPAPLGLPTWTSGAWDPVCQAAQHHELPICMHFGTSAMNLKPAPDSNWLVTVATSGINSMLTLAELLFSPVPHRYPKLQFVLSEGGIGWLPWALERAETAWDRHRWYSGVDVAVNPRDIFARQFHGCFISDHAGIEARHHIGVGNIMWECDYPHSDTDWPQARKRAVEALASVPDDEAHKIVELNARRLFRFTGGR
jgi:predicted TIM-barrel fold metal-dependent hydrolase